MNNIENKPEDKPEQEQEEEPRTDLGDMLGALSAEMEAWDKENINLIPPFHDFKDDPKQVKSVKMMAPRFEPNRGKKYVAVRPVDSQKTFLGIYLGDAPIMLIGAYNIPDQEIQVFAKVNPQIFIPELMKVVFGYECWWARIEDESQLRQITDIDIQNVWYVKALKELTEKQPKE